MTPSLFGLFKNLSVTWVLSAILAFYPWTIASAAGLGDPFAGSALFNISKADPWLPVLTRFFGQKPESGDVDVWAKLGWGLAIGDPMEISCLGPLVDQLKDTGVLEKLKE